MVTWLLLVIFAAEVVVRASLRGDACLVLADTPFIAPIIALLLLLLLLLPLVRHLRCRGAKAHELLLLGLWEWPWGQLCRITAAGVGWDRGRPVACIAATARV